MYDLLTPAERDELAARLQRAAVRFLEEYDLLKVASPATVASYGRTALATDWLMCCVETGQARRELVGRTA